MAAERGGCTRSAQESAGRLEPLALRDCIQQVLKGYELAQLHVSAPDDCTA